MTRFGIRTLLVVALLISITVIIVGLRSAIAGEKEAWATVAGALAVTTSVAASWSAQRVLEQQEDAQKPNPLPTVDFKNRVGLLMLRVTNYGGSVARDIEIEWETPLLDAEGKLIRFNDSGGPEIYVLPPNESVATLIDGHVDFFDKYKDQNLTYSGVIKFKDASGKKNEQAFYLNINQLSNVLTHDTEMPKAFRELQKLPEQMQTLTSEVQQVRRLMELDQKVDAVEAERRRRLRVTTLRREWRYRQQHRRQRR